MISGIVQDMQARVNVTLRHPNRPDVEIEFVVDTGFAGALALPSAAITMLDLPYLQEMAAKMANDESITTDVYVGTILWDGQELKVAVLAMGKRLLLGTALLAGRELLTQFVESGSVTIRNF